MAKKRIWKEHLQLVKKQIVLFFLLITHYTLPQQQLYGTIVDNESLKVIPYVNIGIPSLDLGTISNLEGNFLIEIPKIDEPKLHELLISAIGYETLKIKLEDIYIDNQFLNIQMIPKPIILNEVVVSANGYILADETIGYGRSYGSHFAYWQGDLGLGAQLATKFIARGKRTLKTLNFEIKDMRNEWVLIRVNIYEDDGPKETPGTNVNGTVKPIQIRINKDNKRITVDLTSYHIKVSDDFIVSLELIDFSNKNSEELGLIVYATNVKTASYRKYRSFGTWEKFADNAMAFEIISEVLVKENKAEKLINKNEKLEANKPIISGFIFKVRTPVAGVTILNKATGKTSVSDSDGRYHIEAVSGDILEFEKENFEPSLKRVGSKKFINIQMIEQ